MVIRITTSGQLLYVYQDDCPANALGDLSVSRASNVEFNTNDKTWQAYGVLGEVLSSPHHRRDDALREEVNSLEDLLLDTGSPLLSSPDSSPPNLHR